MSGQIDVGWASPPFGLDAVDQGRTRIVARGSDVPDFASQSVRVLIANAMVLTRRADAVSRYMQAYRDSMDWLYSDPAALVAYGAWAGVSPERARQVRDEFYPKTNLDPDRLTGIDALVADAITYKYLSGPLTPEQLKTLIQVPARMPA
jgi:NitT/TauT family transport system substrate-binding protein